MTIFNEVTASERRMWQLEENGRTLRHTDISRRYAQGDGRIVIETNRERLPQFVKSLDDKRIMDLRPFYQRRSRWKREKQSLLIESFIMNIPVPPVFLYERSYGSYEVMDGQQRLTALRDYFRDEFGLEGLQTWSEINGLTYSELPSSIRAALDRRSISSIVVLKESTATEDEADFIREAVFERLNTGGIQLAPQEIRNALYRSYFNDMITETASWDLFRHIWRIPDQHGDPERLAKNTLYSKMEDVELVLRFFALRHVDHYRDGMKGFLDAYMRSATEFTKNDVDELKHYFKATLATVYEVFGELSFRPFNVRRGEWAKAAHKAFYDAVMQAVFQRLGNRERLIARKDRIISSVERAFHGLDEGAFTGRGNSKNDIVRRIYLFGEVLDSAL